MLDWLILIGTSYIAYKKRDKLKETAEWILEERMRKKIEKSAKLKPIKRENFYFPLFLHVYGRCKERGICSKKKIKLIFMEENLEYDVLGVYSDNIEGTSVWLGDDRVVPLARNDFIMVFPSGLNWKEFLFATELLKGKVELFFKVTKVNKAVNLWLQSYYNIYLFRKFKYLISNDEKSFFVKIEGSFDLEGLMVDVSVDGVLFYVKKGMNQHLVYLPWKVIKAIIRIGANLSQIAEKEPFIEGFSLLLEGKNTVAIIKDELLSRKSEISSDRSSTLEVEEW